MLWTAHGGQAAGTALARVLAGDVSPAGRLPQTWYAADADLPDLLDYDIIGARQTYLYFEGTPLFPFGHGLSYASFAYDDLRSTRMGDGDAARSPSRSPTPGDVTADEVAQLYTRAEDPSVPRPRRELAGPPPRHPGPRRLDGADLRLPLAAWSSGTWHTAAWRLEPGAYELLAGASSEDIRAAYDGPRSTGSPAPPSGPSTAA